MVLGMVLFLIGGVAAWLAITRRSGSLATAGAAALLLAGGCLAVGAWRAAHGIDWNRVSAEQRLWESGPLGRAWLRIRRKLPGQ